MTSGGREMRETYPVEGEAYSYRLEEQDGRLTFELPGGSDNQPAAIALHIEQQATGEGICRDESGRTMPFAWAWVGRELHLWLEGNLFAFQVPDATQGRGRRRSGAASGTTSGDILAPMPGAVLEVLVAEGDGVERNQTVVVMESMKMELLITAPHDGVVRRVSVQPGQQVERGMRLLELAPEADATGP